MTSNVQEIISFLDKYSDIKLYELILVNDGSTDNTDAVLAELSSMFANVKIVSYPVNKGKGGAVKTGVISSVGEYVLFMDADLSTKLEAITDVWELKDNHSIIIGSRKHKMSTLVEKQPLYRRFIGKCCNTLTNLLVSLNIEDTQCGFKFFNGDLIRAFCSKQTLDNFAFDVELLYMAKLNNKSVYEIPVVWENDTDSRVSVFRSSILFFRDLFSIRKNKTNYII